MPDRESMPYRPCVGIALFNRDGRVFIGSRKWEGDPEDSAARQAPWQMPQGGIDKGEDPLAAARRELWEETNVRSVQLLGQTEDWISYELPDDLLGVAFKGKYRGQRQLWFAFLFEGEESEIDVASPGDGTAPAEFNSWRWEELDALPDLIVPFKRGIYLEVVAAFKHLPATIRQNA